MTRVLFGYICMSILVTCTRGCVYVLQTAEIGTFPPPLSNSMICPLLSLLPEEPREGEEEAA